MVIIFENGRLGNQLFQYSKVKELYPDHRLVLVGFGSLTKVIEGVDALVVKTESIPSFVVRLFERLFDFLALIRFFGVIQEVSDECYLIEETRGLTGIYMLRSSFFQHSAAVNGLALNLKLDPGLVQAASDWIKDNTLSDSHQSLVFVHIRRGDYLRWPNDLFPAVLDQRWFVDAMDRMRARVENPFFIILSDDKFYALDCFGNIPNVVISRNGELVDFAIMSLCRHGILSASSYAWWGACFSKAGGGEGSVYIGPKYWAGHRSRKWFPCGFVTSWILYV